MVKLSDNPVSARQYIEEHPREGTVSEIERFPSSAGEPVKVYSIDDALVVGDPAIILAPSGEILYESSAYRDFPEPLRNHIEVPTLDDPEACLYDDTEYCLLSGMWDYQFWHWIMDYLPRVLIAEAAGFSGKYIVPKLSGFIRESLEMLGISESRLVIHQKGLARVASLFIVQSIEGFGELPNHPSLVDELRRQLLAASADLDSVVRAERLYIARKIADRPRKVVNEGEFLEFLQPFGFQRVYMEEHSLPEQIAIASQARILVGPHGSGMLHALFMPRESVVIECFSPHYVLTSHVRTLSLLGHRYYSVVGSNGPLWPYKSGMDVQVDMTLFEATLVRELSQLPIA